MKKKKLLITDFRVKRAIVLYKSGMPIKNLCKQLHMDGQTIRKILLDNNFLRTASEAVRRGKSKATIDDFALDVLTPEVIYWIGFLYADGSVDKIRPRITLALTESDIDHLKKFINFFGEGLSIRKISNEGVVRMGYKCKAAYRVSFSSKKIYKRLCELGVGPNKTYNITPHSLLYNSRDFWRGVVDGDGWVCNNKAQGIGLCGHENTIIAFLKFIEHSGIETKTTALKSKKSDHLWSCEIHSNKAKLILKLLYENSTTYLDRKYQKYQEIINK